MRCAAALIRTVLTRTEAALRTFVRAAFARMPSPTKPHAVCTLTASVRSTSTVRRLPEQLEAALGAEGDGAGAG